MRAIWGRPGNFAYLNVTNASFWGGLEKAVQWESGGLLSMSQARFEWARISPAVDIINGRAMLQGNFFQGGSDTAVHVGVAATRVMLVGNMIGW